MSDVTSTEPVAAPAPIVATEATPGSAAAEAPSAPVAAVEAVISDVEAIVLHWFNTRVSNSPISRDVDAINHLSSILPDLIAALEAKA